MIICVEKHSYMDDYLEKYGPHFNLKLCEFAINNMQNSDNNFIPKSKEWVNGLLLEHRTAIQRLKLYDCLFVANTALSDFWGSAITDEEHLVNYIKDAIDDVDLPEGYLFYRFLSDCEHKDLNIPWKEML